MTSHDPIFIHIFSPKIEEYDDDLLYLELPITVDSLISFSNRFEMNLTMDKLIADWSLVGLLVEDELFVYIVDDFDIERINHLAFLFYALPPEKQKKYLESIDEDRYPRYNLDELIRLADNLN